VCVGTYRFALYCAKRVVSGVGYIQGLPRFVVELVLTPIVGPLILFNRVFYTENVELKIPSPPVVANKEDPSEQLEMANPIFPSKAIKLPSCVVSVISPDGMHLGFGTFVNTTGTGKVLVTAMHVFRASLQHSTELRLRNSAGVANTPYKYGEYWVVRASNALDQVYLSLPNSFSSVLAVKCAEQGMYDPSKPITVLSPPTTEGGAFESSVSKATVQSPLRLKYPATTIPGSSGSPLFQGKAVVGIHVSGAREDGKIVNRGTALLGVPAGETSSKAAERPWTFDDGDDFTVEEGFEEIDDYLDVAERKRGSRILYKAGGKRVMVAAFATVNKPKFQPAEYWADDEDFGLEARFRSIRKVPSGCSQGISSSSSRCEPLATKGSSALSSKRLVDSLATDTAEQYDPIPCPSLPSPSQEHRKSLPSSVSGSSQIGALEPRKPLLDSKPSVAPKASRRRQRKGSVSFKEPLLSTQPPTISPTSPKKATPRVGGGTR